jgi:hypothetical protein
MAKRFLIMAAFVAGSLLPPSSSLAAPMGTAFTYQGRLDDLGVPANDTCSFQFSLWDAVSGGTQIASTITVSNLVITDGTFTTTLDFGAGAFAGQARWLLIAVRCTGEPNYTSLSPRQALTPSPHTLFSQNGGASQWVTGADGRDLGYSGGGVAITGGSSPFQSGSGVFIEGYPTQGIIFAYDYTNNVPKNLVLNSPGGRVGIGTDSPNGKLQATSNSEAAIIGLHTSNWIGVYGESQSYQGVLGKSPNGTGVAGEGGGAFNAGVAGFSNNVNGWGGYFKNNVGGFALYADGKAAVRTLEIVGGADIVEGFDTGDEPIEPGTVVVIDDRNPGALRVSNRAYDQRVAGIVSGAGGIAPGLHLKQEGGLDGDTPVAMSGRVFVRCSKENGPIRPGDLLTTAETSGHAMRATDADRSQGAVIGKAMTSLEDDNPGLVLVLVNLQ